MPIRVAIDGFNGVSRQILASVLAGGFSDLFEIVTINEPMGSDVLLRRLRYDSTYGKYPATAKLQGDNVRVNAKEFAVTSVDSPEDFDWEKSGVDLVVIDGARPGLSELASGHIDRGAKKVVVAGSPGEVGRTILFGLNEGSYDPDNHHIVGPGTARLNALAPLASIVQKHFAIARGSYAIVHPLVREQVLADRVGIDALTSRSALNIMPNLNDRTETELGEIEPVLGSKLLGSVVHVPISPVAWITLAAETERRFEIEEAISVFSTEAESEQFAGLVGLTRESLVSSDFTGDARSVVIAIDEIAMTGRAFVSVRGWFDAEWALACRTADLIALVCEAGIPGTA